MCGNGETTRTEGGSRIVLATRGFNSKHQCSILQVSISILEACEFNFAILEETRGRTALSSSARSASKGRRTQHLDLVSVFGLRLQDFFFYYFCSYESYHGLVWSSQVCPTRVHGLAVRSRKISCLGRHRSVGFPHREWRRWRGRCKPWGFHGRGHNAMHYPTRHCP